MRGHRGGHNSSMDDTLALLAPTVPSPSPFINPAWLVPNWYVNWLTGNDANDGLTPATAVKTIADGIVFSKWRTNEPQLRVGITRIHVLAAEPVGAELIVLR